MNEKIILFSLMLLLASNAAAESMVGDTDFVVNAILLRNAKYQPYDNEVYKPYVPFRVDVKEGEKITASYSQWNNVSILPDQPPCHVIAPPAEQPNNILQQAEWQSGSFNRDTKENFWIHFVPPENAGDSLFTGSGETQKRVCVDNLGIDTCVEEFTVPVGQGGAWEVRFGPGVFRALCAGTPRWGWGIKDWSIGVTDSSGNPASGGRIWREEWRLFGGTFSRDFYILAKSKESPQSCENLVFDPVLNPNCRSSLFKASFTDAYGLGWSFLSNSTGISFDHDGDPSTASIFLRESVPNFTTSEMTLCGSSHELDGNPLEAGRLDVTGKEHRIYLLEPEFFNFKQAPVIENKAYSQRAPAGINFSFDVDSESYYELVLDLDGDNQFDPLLENSRDVIIQGECSAGTVTVAWDGLDAEGTLQPNGNYNAKVKVYSEVANFPLSDFEGAQLALSKRSQLGNYLNKNVFWIDRLAGGSDNTSGSGIHSWSTCIRDNGTLLNPSTNCFPKNFTVAQCNSPSYYNCCPANPIGGYDTSIERLDLTVGDNDWINTWIYGEVAEEPIPFVLGYSIPISHRLKIIQFNAEPLNFEAGQAILDSMAIKAKNMGEVLSDVTIEVEVLNPKTNQPIEPAIIAASPCGQMASGATCEKTLADFPTLDLINLNSGAYKLTAKATSGSGLEDQESLFFIIKEPVPVPELSLFLVPLIAFSALAFIYSRKPAQ